MAIARRLVGVGISPFAAQQIIGDSTTGLTAVGSTQATGLQLGSANNSFTTVATGTGCILPTDATSPGDEVMVYNGGAQTLKVYGSSTDVINSGAAGASFSVATTKSAIFTRQSSSFIIACLSS